MKLTLAIYCHKDISFPYKIENMTVLQNKDQYGDEPLD